MDIAPEQVVELQSEGTPVQLIDVRETYEWDAGRIPGARHVELALVANEADSIERGEPVVFVCRVGGRSTMAAGAFRRAGFDAYSLAGGVLAWKARGLPFDGEVADH
jgi:rhodanese-related sulfurtransferase